MARHAIDADAAKGASYGPSGSKPVITPSGRDAETDAGEDTKRCVGPSTASCAFAEGCPKFNNFEGNDDGAEARQGARGLLAGAGDVVMGLDVS